MILGISPPWPSIGVAWEVLCRAADYQGGPFLIPATVSPAGQQEGPGLGLREWNRVPMAPRWPGCSFRSTA